MPLPLLILAAAVALTILPAQASPDASDPVTTASLAEEIVSENCYIAREPVADEAGQIRVHVELLCD